MEKLKGNRDTTMYLLSSHLHKVEVFGAQLCPALCNSMDCSPPGSSVHGTLQARILEWVAFCFSRGSSQPRHRTQASPTASGFFTCLSHQESYTSITSSIINIPHASFGVTDETTLTYYNHPKPIVYIMCSTKRERTAPRGRIGAVHSIQFWQTCDDRNPPSQHHAGCFDCPISSLWSNDSSFVPLHLRPGKLLALRISQSWGDNPSPTHMSPEARASGMQKIRQ